MKEIYRILDANFNRAREAIRVIEDYLRFVVVESVTYQRLRLLRRRLGEINQASIFKQQLLARRDTVSDMGSPGERRKIDEKEGRKNIAQILTANFKRIEEALRVLEEYTKTISINYANRLSKLRFEAYAIERKIQGYLDFKSRFLKAQLYVLLPEGLSLRQMRLCAQAVIRGGADIIQLREKSVSDRVFITKARLLRRMTQDANILLIINDRTDIACSCQADGVHLGKNDLAITLAREIMGGLKIIGATSHQLCEAQQAQTQGADYISVGPFFDSPLKPDLRPRGFDYLPRVSKHIDIPYVAIGGINHENIGKVIKLHQRLFDYPLKVAISSGIFEYRNIESITRKIKKILRKRKH